MIVREQDLRTIHGELTFEGACRVVAASAAAGSRRLSDATEGAIPIRPDCAARISRWPLSPRALAIVPGRFLPRTSEYSQFREPLGWRKMFLRRIGRLSGGVP